MGEKLQWGGVFWFFVLEDEDGLMDGRLVSFYWSGVAGEERGGEGRERERNIYG
jgi:hypothetical protein